VNGRISRETADVQRISSKSVDRQNVTVFEFDDLMRLELRCRERLKKRIVE
jgi:hypothetical protein